MTLRLNSKSDIAKAKAAERNQEIQEGLKISRRVDSLRELEAKEDENLQKFRTETLSSIMADIKSATAEKESILSEVLDLRKEKAKGFADVQEAQGVLIAERNDLQLREKKVSEDIRAIEIDRAKLKDSFDAVEQEALNAKKRTELAERLYDEAFSAREEVKKTLQDAKEIQMTAIVYAKNTQKMIEDKWLDVRAYEASVQERSAAVAQSAFKVTERESAAEEWETWINKRKFDLDEREVQVHMKEKEINVNRLAAQDEADRARTHTEEAIKQRMLADSEREDAQSALEDAKRAKNDAVRIRDEADGAFSEREASIAKREKELKQREEENRQISEKLENAAIRLADRTKVREKILKNL